MKRVKHGIGLVLGIIFLISCENGMNKNVNEEMKIFKEHPVTISWGSSQAKEMESFKADVTVYSKNSRVNKNASVSNKYRLMTKKVGDEILARIDFPKGKFGDREKMVLKSNSEIIIADKSTGKVEMRISEKSKNEDLDYLTGNLIYGRINLDKIKSISEKLNFDITEEHKEVMTVSLPCNYFIEQENYGRISTKIKFDLKDELLKEIEMIDVDLEGNTITTTIMPVYEEYNGEMIKIGQISIIDTKMTEMLSGLENVEYFNSIDEIPEASKEEYEKAKAKGLAFDVNNMRYGNPADLSNVETIIEVYENIIINDCDRTEFRLLEGDR